MSYLRSYLVECLFQEEELPKASLMRILRLNRVLLPANILGCLFAMAVGVIQPLSAIFVSQILRVILYHKRQNLMDCLF